MTAHRLEQKLGRLLILETTRLECPEMLTNEDWKEYSHLKNEYRNIYHNNRGLKLKQLRKALESGVI